MPDLPSRRVTVGALVARLSEPDTVAGESAVARLIVIGERAEPALVTLLNDTSAPPAARSRALRTLAAIRREATIDPAAAAVLEADDALAMDAVELLGEVLLDSEDAAGSDRALEHLTRLVLDSSVPERQRLGIMEVLSRLSADLRQPVFDVLSTDANVTVAARARNLPQAPTGRLEQWSGEGRLPTADTLLEAVAAEAGQTPITTLRRLIDLARAQEKVGSDAESWRRIRGALHDTLAQRGSVLALYDLRETLEQTDEPISTHFLSAAMAVADAACLDAIAVRWVHAGQDAWLRDQLERIFHAIINRARLRRQSPQLAKVLTRHPSAGPLVAMAPRTKPPGP